MINWLAATLLVAGFILLLKPLRVISASREVLSTSRAVAATLGNKTLSELDKEKAMQRYSLALFRCFFLIALGCAAALALPLAVLWLLQSAGLASVDDTLAITLDWRFITGSTVAGIAALLFLGKSK